jgi:chromosome segregation ATPase
MIYGLIFSIYVIMEIEERNMPKAKEIVNELLIEDVIVETKSFSKENIALQEENKALKEHLLVAEQKILETKKSNEEITNNEFNVRRTLQETQAQLALVKKETEEKEKQVEYLKGELNKLANLFDEYIKAYQDQTRMLLTSINNTQLVGKYLDSKVEAYNKGDKK